MVKALLAAGASRTAHNNNETSCLQIAAQGGHLACATLLVGRPDNQKIRTTTTSACRTFLERGLRDCGAHCATSLASRSSASLSPARHGSSDADCCPARSSARCCACSPQLPPPRCGCTGRPQEGRGQAGAHATRPWRVLRVYGRSGFDRRCWGASKPFCCCSAHAAPGADEGQLRAAAPP